MRTLEFANRATRKLGSSVMCTLLLLLLSTAGAAAQNVLAKIPIPATSADGQVVVNKVLNRVAEAGSLDVGSRRVSSLRAAYCSQPICHARLESNKLMAIPLIVGAATAATLQFNVSSTAKDTLFSNSKNTGL